MFGVRKWQACSKQRPLHRVIKVEQIIDKYAGTSHRLMLTLSHQMQVDLEESIQPPRQMATSAS
jgi:hypothetical protein